MISADACRPYVQQIKGKLPGYSGGKRPMTGVLVLNLELTSLLMELRLKFGQFQSPLKESLQLY